MKSTENTEHIKVVNQYLLHLTKVLSAPKGGRVEELEVRRARVRKLDRIIIRLIARRLVEVRAIAAIKYAKGMEIYQPEQERRVVEELAEFAREMGLSSDFIRRLWPEIMAEAKRVQQHEWLVLAG